MTRLVSVLVLFALTSAAAAQAPGQTPPATTAAVREKNPSDAVLISVGTTLAGFALTAASEGNGGLFLLGFGTMYVGPSTGQWYAGRLGGIGLVTRTLGGVLFLSGFSKIDAQQGNDCLGYTDQECADAEARWHHEEKVGEYLLYTGAGLWVGSTLFDFVMAHRAATAWNREHQLSIAPALMPAAGGRATGLTLQLTF